MFGCNRKTVLKGWIDFYSTEKYDVGYNFLFSLLIVIGFLSLSYLSILFELANGVGGGLNKGVDALFVVKGLAI